MLAFDPPLLGLPHMWLAEQNLFNIIGHYAMLLSDFLCETFIPNNVEQSQVYPSSGLQYYQNSR